MVDVSMLKNSSILLSNISTLIKFGRGKDKQKRKSKHFLAGGIGAAIGAGTLGYTSPTKGRIFVDNRSARTRRRLNNIINDSRNPREVVSAQRDLKAFNEVARTETQRLAKEYDRDIGKKVYYFPERYLKRLEKVRINKLAKRSLVGAGLGASIALGGTYLYNNYHKKRNE